MSYVDPSQDPDQNPDENASQASVAQSGNQAAQPSQSGSSSNDTPPTTSSGGGSGIVTGGNTSTPIAAKPSSSGSWTNLDSYLNANADQGGRLGSDIASSVNAQGNTAQNDLTNLNSDFNSQVNANTVNTNQNAVDDALNTATSGQALTPDQIAAFQAQSNANYSGPTDTTSDQYYGQTQNDINNASQAAQQTQSEAGRNVLLANQYQNASKNGYNQGENNLDQMLLENSQGGQQALQPLANQWSGLTGALTNSVTAGNAAVQSAVATNAATSANAQNALNSNLSGLTDTLNNQVATSQQQYQTQNAALTKAIANAQASGTTVPEQIDPSVLSQLGITPGSTLWGLDLNNYVNPYTPTAYNTQTVATPQQYAEYQALNQLAGTSPTLLSNPALAGTAPASAFNSSQLQTDIATKSAAYQQAYATTPISTYSYYQGSPSDMDFGLVNLVNFGAPPVPWGTSSFTAQQLENQMIPAAQSMVAAEPGTAPVLAALQKALAAFKTGAGFTNVVNPAPPQQVMR